MSIKSFLYTSSLALILLFPVAALADLDAQLKAAEFTDQQFIRDEQASISRATSEWGKAINQHDPIKVTALYENPFILYATFKTKIDTLQGLIKYFTDLTAKQNLKVVFNEQNIRVYGAIAVNSGTYTFTYTEKGETKEVGARFTFVYALSSEGWRIVDHHSSELPE